VSADPARLEERLHAAAHQPRIQVASSGCTASAAAPPTESHNSVSRDGRCVKSLPTS
jgi:hypothetical protein